MHPSLSTVDRGQGIERLKNCKIKVQKHLVFIKRDNEHKLFVKLRDFAPWWRD